MEEVPVDRQRGKPKRCLRGSSTPEAVCVSCDGAGDGNRTRDVQLGKLAFCL